MKTIFVIIWLMMLSIGQQLNQFIYEKNVNKIRNKYKSYYSLASTGIDFQPVQASDNSRDHAFFLRKNVNVSSGKNATYNKVEYNVTPIQINFQNQSTTPPTGYDKDYGEPYGLKSTSGLTYGWVRADNQIPLSLVGNGRNRNQSGFTLLENTLMHMQYNHVGGSNGVNEEGIWEIALPTGSYEVTILSGDPNVETTAGTHHVINAEGENIIDYVALLYNANLQSNVKVVTINDGKLTLDANGGLNTKINTIEIVPVNSTPLLIFASAYLNKSLPADGTNADNTLSNIISTSNNTTPLVILEARDASNNVPAWLKVAGVVLDGTLIHATVEPEIVFEYDVTGLIPGTYTATVTATANGYVQGEFTTSFNVTGPNINFPVQINFQNQNTTTPTGYKKDFGQPYGLKIPSGLTYGWVTADANKTPLDLVGNGRNRNRIGFSDLENTLMHIQYNHVNGNHGIKKEGIWEIAVPNGEYQVTVTMGDTDDESLVGTRHVLNAEGINIVDYVAVLSAANIRSDSKKIAIEDGKLTLDATGGHNSKINTVVIHQFCSDHPTILQVSINDGATNVDVNTSITANSICFLNPGQVVDDNTLNNNTVFLRNVNTGLKVSVSSLNSTGGGDAITLTPADPLEPFTMYEFVVTSGLKDLAGVSFIPFSSTFTTGEGDLPPPSPIAFTKQTLLNGPTAPQYTSLAIGPDDKFYGLNNDGSIHRWTINADGTLANQQIINSLKNAEGGNRLALGMVFDPAATRNNLIVWVSHSYYALGNSPEWTGKITRLSGANLENVQDYVINLPRSGHDHATNGLAFKQNEPGALYISQGSNTAMGLPDKAWGNRPERLLCAAILRLDITEAEAAGLPINVKTEEDGNYNPYDADVPLTMYATGVRNAYDLVWHTNGQLYVPNNGSAAGGGAPRETGSMQDIRPSTQNDFLYRVEESGYYGHPNPTRNEWILNKGNLTSGVDGPDDVSEYTIPTEPEDNYRGISFDFDKNKSPNGVIEYKNSVFNGALQGKILVVRYSQNDDIIVLTPGGASLDIISSQTGIPGFTGFNNPLDLIEHVPTGNIYVSGYGPESGPGVLYLLKPDLTAARLAGSEQKKDSPGDLMEITISAFEEGATNEYVLFPNPVGETLHIRFASPIKGKTKVSLSDSMGKIILEQTYNISENENIIHLDFSGIEVSPGIVYLNIKPENADGKMLRLLKQ